MSATAPHNLWSALLIRSSMTFIFSLPLQQLFVATSILGATIMPHNLYLHSSVVQTRNYPRTEPGMRIAIRYSGIDSSVSMALAMIINCSILILAAATMYDPDVKVVRYPISLSSVGDVLAVGNPNIPKHPYISCTYSSPYY